MNMSFYVTLPSSASKNIYTSNFGGSFRTALSRSLELHDYEVALVSFQYYGQKWGSLNDVDRKILTRQWVPLKKSWALTWKNDEIYVEVNKLQTNFVSRNYDLADAKSALFKFLKDAFAVAGATFEENNNRWVLTNATSKPFTFLISKKLTKLANWPPTFSSTFTMPKGNIYLSIPELSVSVKSKELFVIPENKPCTVMVNDENQSVQSQMLNLAPGFWDMDLLMDAVKTRLNVELKIIEQTTQMKKDGGWERRLSVQFTLDANKTVTFNPNLKQILNIPNGPISQNGQMVEFRFDIVHHFTEPKELKLKRPSFSSWSKLCGEINDLINTECGKKVVQFEYVVDETETRLNPEVAPSKTIEVTGYDSNYSFKLSDGLCTKLCFPRMVGKWFVMDDKPYDSDNLTSDLNSDMINAFWVYCDCIADQLVGDRQINLLRILPNNAPENVWYIETVDPYYYPLVRGQLSTIKITVCNGQTT